MGAATSTPQANASVSEPGTLGNPVSAVSLADDHAPRLTTEPLSFDNLSVSNFKKLVDTYELNKRRVSSDEEMLKLLADNLSSQHDLRMCVHAMKTSELFSECKLEGLEELAKKMSLVRYAAGDVIIEQGEPHDFMLIVAGGKVARMRQHDADIGSEGRMHRMEVGGSGYTIGAHHALDQVPAYAAAHCLTDLTAFRLTTKELNNYMGAHPDFTIDIVHSLNKEIRSTIAGFWGMGSTPLLEQKASDLKGAAFYAPAIAAAIESFYRSALAGILVTRLNPGQPLVLFPNMQVQVPTRVVYITGLKQIRFSIEEHVDFNGFAFPDAARVVAACAPGIIMTPVSSVLEACNVEAANPEPLWRRWMRGFQFRCLREVIFAIGLNQLSDYMEERVPPTIESPFLRNLAGSLVAGLSAGYLSHVPHNLSTLKLMQPHRGYKELFLEYAEASRARVPVNVPPAHRNAATYALACIFPKGLVVRTAQIAGSFIILNGFINLLKDFDSGGMWDGVKRPFTKMIPQKADGHEEQIMGAGMHDGSGVSGEMGKTQLAQRLLTARAGGGGGGDSSGSSSGSAGSGSSGPSSGSSSAGGSDLSGDSSSLMFAAANARNGGGSGGIMRHDSSNKSSLSGGGGSGGSDGAGAGADGPSSAPPPGGAVTATSAALPFWQRTLRGWVVAGQPHHMAAARQQQVQLQQRRRPPPQQQQHRTVASAAAASRAGGSVGGWGQVAGGAPRQLPRSGPLLHASAFWHGAAARPSLNAGFGAQHAMAKQPRSLFTLRR